MSPLEHCYLCGAELTRCIDREHGVSTVDFSGGNAAIAITAAGSDWYWAVTACMMTATIAFAGLATTKPRQHRIFHYITAAITMVASIAYFSMVRCLSCTWNWRS